MSEKQEVYVDGIDKINLTAGMVRYDMVTLEPTEEGNAPETKEKIRVIMPLNGFLNTFDTMQKMVDQLIEKGILRKNEKAKK